MGQKKIMRLMISFPDIKVTRKNCLKQLRKIYVFSHEFVAQLRGGIPSYFPKHRQNGLF